MNGTKEIVVENKMGVMPVNKLLLSMSLPMMVSMLIQALYNIVDSIFVARISENALSAVSLAYPVQTLMIALLGGTSVGMNALLSRSLGEKDQEKANQVATNTVFVAVVIYLILLVMGIFLVEPFFYSQTSDPEIVEYGIEYLRVILCCSMGICAQFIFEKMLQSTGKTVCTMITQMTGAIINLILDPIFIFGYFGVPAMGVRGAAIATVAGQIIAGALALFMNLKMNHEVQLNFKGFRPSGHIIGQIYKIGLPSIVMQSIGSIMVYGMNQILMAFSSTATAVFGVYFKLQSFVFMPVFGMNNGLVPIVAYNFGARKKDRLLKAFKLAVLYAEGIMVVGMIIFFLFTEQLLLMFDASEQMLSIGAPALRIICIHFVLAGYDIIGGTLCQALGNAVYSMITSICRQLLVLLPVAYVLSLMGNVNLVWWSFPIAELFAVVLNTIFLMKTNKNIISKI